MGTNNKALMTHYTEGAIISRELEQMMHDYAAEARFDRELVDDLELFTERKQRQQNTFGVT
jgi:hypothetical protein